jgi:PPP family 3-phenylpropionic acid transporter
VRPPFNQIVYSKLSGYYFFYFAVLGTVLPYLSLYFQSLSFSAVQIGQLMAILMATKIVSPNLIKEAALKITLDHQAWLFLVVFGPFFGCCWFSVFFGMQHYPNTKPILFKC